MSQSALVLHRGAREVTLEELKAVKTPPATSTHFPVPFDRTLDITLTNLRDAGFTPTKTRLALLREERFFATIDLDSALVPGVTVAVAIRSSHDCSLSYGFVAGNRTFCCDNLALTSDMSIHVKRKHSRNGEACFATAIARVIRERLPQFRKTEAHRLELMQRTELSDQAAESYLLRGYEQQILSIRTLPTAIKEWRTPSHPEFSEARNVFRLYQAFTSALAPRSRTEPQAHAQATIRLGRLLEVQNLPGASSPDRTEA